MHPVQNGGVSGSRLPFWISTHQYASNQIEEQIQKLRHFTSVTVYSNMTSKEVAIHRPDWLPDLNTIRKNIAEILRKVVDVVGRYASGFLNTDARNSVRSFILSLPARWASLNTNPASSEANEAHRIMAFASDTSSILRSMQDIFSQALSTAEHWLGTLHRVPFVNSLVPPSRFATATTTTTTTTTTTSTLPGSPFSSPYMDESPENMIGLTPSYYSSTLPPPPPVFSPQSTPSSLLLQPTSSPDWLPSFDTLPVPALTNTHPSAGLRKRPNQTSSVSDSSTVTPIKQEPSSNVSNPVKTNSSKKRRK
ncbi:hypothetical protein HMI54_010653 [Coelomomyces lativittatus]|nr:hypothetical protein HMI55_004657 [Coelomomyces lativittatus]KAJ1500641.1 hypothetical protein HMI54_010653 [Coelomomyces lativittatus]